MQLDGSDLVQRGVVSWVQGWYMVDVFQMVGVDADLYESQKME